MQIIYTVEYQVSGTDHSGYCSGEYASDDRLTTYTTTQTRSMPHRVSSLTDLNFRHNGCNSGGSGYCHGFNQILIALAVISAIEPTNPLHSDSDSSDPWRPHLHSTCSDSDNSDTENRACDSHDSDNSHNQVENIDSHINRINNGNSQFW